MPKVRMSSWNSIYRGVEINCKDAHIIVSSLPTRSAKLDEILRIENCGSGWRLPTEKEAQVIRRFLQPINQLMRDNGGSELNRRGTIWLHGNYGVPDKLGDVQGRILSLRFGICCWNWWRIDRDFRLVRTVD